MLKVYDFLCSNGHIFEGFVYDNCTHNRCGCGADAKRIPSAPSFHLDGTTGDFPGAAMKWAKTQKEKFRKLTYERMKIADKCCRSI